MKPNSPVSLLKVNSSDPLEEDKEMAFTISHGADEFRIGITGRFAGPGVKNIETAWKNALRVTAPLRYTVDISRMSGYDTAGRELLCEMYRHGTQFAAGTPSSLDFLAEISKALRRAPAMSATRDPVRITPEKQNASFPPLRAFAAGK
jgi:hypothetical protein